MMESFDAIVIGGGPAGAASAISLQQHYGKRVLILERGDFTQQRIGEQVSHSVFDFLDFLEVPVEKFGDLCFTPNFGKTSVWGSTIESQHHSMFTSQGATYQLNRDTFDETLLLHFVDNGGVVIPRCTNLHITFLDTGWEVQCKHPEEGALVFHSDYLIEASGRQSKVGRSLGMERVAEDSLVGVGTFLHHPNSIFEQHQRIESCEYGWWYYAGLSPELAVVACFTDSDILQQRHLNHKAAWNQHLANMSSIAEFLAGCESAHPKLWIKPATSQYCHSSFPDKFIAVGDAALSFDPVSSMGIGFALSSACNGVGSLMSGSSDAMHLYQQDLRYIYQEYKSIKSDIYRREKRWSDQPFWQRRQSFQVTKLQP